MMSKLNRWAQERGILRRGAGLALAAVMIFHTLPFGANANTVDEDTGLCEHHPAHTSRCGYAAAQAGAPCTHVHGEECYTAVTQCAHTHTAACYLTEPTGDPQPIACDHVCSVDSGCITQTLSCNHTHDEECGFQAETQGSACAYVCMECTAETQPPQPTQETQPTQPTEATTDGSKPNTDVSKGNVVISKNGSYTITGSTSKYFIQVASGVNASLTLENVRVDASSTAHAALEIGANSNVTVILIGSNTLKGGQACAGLQRNGGSGTLTIKGSGTLTAEGVELPENSVVELNGVNLEELLPEGCCFYQDGAPVKLAQLQENISGPVTVEVCSHAESVVTYTHDSGTVVHTKTCNACGKIWEEEACGFAENGLCSCGAELAVALAGADDLIYSGTAQTPAITVTVDGQTLAEENYSAAYSDNVRAGEASVTVTGVTFSGSVSAAFPIAEAENTPNIPESAMSVESSCKTVGDVELPEGWQWQETDQSVALTAGAAVQATALYTGDDKGNYKTEAVTVEITRAACDHANTELKDKKDASCTEKGYTGDTVCLDCNEVVEKGQEIPMADHVGGTATCVKGKVCTVCGNEYTDPDGAAHGQTELRDKKDASCTEKGYTGDTVCLDCNEIVGKGQEIPMADHVGGTATCVKGKVCTVCGNEYTDPDGAAHGQTELKDKKDSSCTEKGYTGDTVCLDCNEIVEKGQEIPMADHVGGTATCVKGKVCTVCGNEYTDPDGAAHGQTELRDKKDASCEEKGYTGDTVCTVCGKIVSAGQQIPATGHNFQGKWTDDKNGQTHSRECACGEAQTKFHRWDNGKVTLRPTETKSGIRTYTCKDCGAKLYRTLPAGSPAYTGDTFQMGVWITVLVASGVALIALLVAIKLKGGRGRQNGKFSR